MIDDHHHTWKFSKNWIELLMQVMELNPKKERSLRDQECDELNVSGMIQKLLFFFYVFATV
jgi:hypothetical protein